MNQRKIGVLLSYLAEGIQILTSIVYTPIMLRLLGQSEYGLYQLVYSIVAYLGLLSMGFSSSYMRFYSRYKAKEDRNGIARLNGMFISIFVIISIICLVCGTILVGNAEDVMGSGLSKAELDKARILMTILVINLTITFLNSVFDCYLTAQEKFVFQKLLIVLKYLFNPFITLPLLIMGYGAVGIVAVTTVLTILNFIVSMLYCMKKLKMEISFHKFDIVLFKEMWGFTFFIFLNQIIDQINWSVDKFLLGRLSGTIAVAIYGVGSQINSMYLNFSTTISNVFVPQVNKLVAEDKDKAELDLIFTKIGRIQYLLMMLILSGFVLWGKEFITFWAGEEYKETYYVVILLIVPVTIPLIQNIGIEIQRAMNKHKVRSIVYFGISVFNVIISIPLIQKIGVPGAALGTAISLIIGNVIFMNIYYHTRLGIDMIYFWKNILKLMPTTIICFLLGMIIKRIIVVNSMYELILVLIVYSILYSIAMWMCGMNAYEKGLFIGVKGKVIRKK